MKEKFWYYSVRKNLYDQLVKRFGPLSSWEGSYPKDKEGFKKFCESFAVIVGAKSGDAVEQQIRWATTTQENIGRDHMPTYFGNKVAAIDAEFITKLELPVQIICEYSEDKEV